MLVSFEVDDADAVAARAAAVGAPVVAALATELGQHHLMVQDPDGTVVDVIEPVPLSPPATSAAWPNSDGRGAQPP